MNLKNIAKTVGITAAKIADNMVTGGAITNAVEDTVDNPKGAFDWLKFTRVLVSATVPTLLIIALVKGWVTMDELKELAKIFGV